MDHLKVVESLRKSLSEYVSSNHLNSLVLGVSGGLDSALCAALAKPVCDYHGMELIGRSITIATNKSEEIQRAAAVGKAFCTSFKEADFGNDFASMVKILMEDDEPGDLTHERKVRRGNLKARLRMIRLFDLASKHKGLVLSTDNLSEYELGFWTLHGDVGDYGMIQYLWKTEVYDLSKYLVQSLRTEHAEDAATALEQCVHAVPTDGLGITSSDLEQFGAQSYDEVDRILKIWLCKDEDMFAWDDFLKFDGRPESYNEFLKLRASYEDHKVVKRHETSGYKRKNPLSIERSDINGLDPS
jgi:NH3-dependent NAD+ synthetase